MSSATGELVGGFAFVPGRETVGLTWLTIHGSW
jgi:hypothetical protein